jgi:O-acetyl-ADP-ribose deacetylase
MIRVVLGDPAEVPVEGLLRSVDSAMEPCTAVERGIGLRAGEKLLERLRAFGVTPVGAAVVTPGGELPAQFLIHVVIRSPEQPITETGIRRALLNGLRQAASWEMKTIALPPLGVGAGNLDAEESARIVVEVVRAHGTESRFPEEVVVTVANRYEEEAFLREVDRDPAGDIPIPEAGS